MFYTLTLNPALDYFMDFPNEISNHQKTGDTKIIVGGKGINASIILKNLEVQNKAIYVAGGTMGIKFEELVKEKEIVGIKIDSKVDTRINVKANFTDTYELNAEGSKLDGEMVLKSVLEKVKQMTKEDTLFIMGSLPNGMTFKHLETIVQEAAKLKVKLVFDLSKKHLAKLVKYQPEVVKPNKKELEELFECVINTKEEAFTYAQKLIDNGAKRVLVSFDKSGSIYLDKEHKRIIEGVTIKEVNGSGAGDSMIAAFMAGLHKELPINEVLQLASAAGTATASVIDIADAETIFKYKEQINIKESK